MTEPMEQLVVAVRDGHVRVEAGGRLPRLATRTNWPDPRDLVDCVGDPDATIMAPATPLVSLNVMVSLLDAPAAPTGDWREPDRLDESAEVRQVIDEGLTEWADAGRRPPERPAWFAPGWRRAADAWIDDVLQQRGRGRTGPSRMLKFWSLSAILEVPTDAEPVYFKAVCDLFRQEPAIISLLHERLPPRQQAWLPDVLAVDHDRSWLLMERLPGGHHTRWQRHLAPRAARAIAELQSSTCADVGALLAAGLPDRRLEPTLAAFERVVSSEPEIEQLEPADRDVLDQLIPWLRDQAEELAATGPPMGLSHGDLHTGNVSGSSPNVSSDDSGEQRLVLFDWTDASVSFPTADAVLLAHSSGPSTAGGAGATGINEPDGADAVWTAYAGPWRDILPATTDWQRIRRLSRPVNGAFQAVSYAGIFAAQEPRTRWEMAGGVLLSVRDVVQAWRDRG